MALLKFDESLASNRWFKKPFPPDYEDHIEKVKQQLIELDGESREILSYKLINGTIMTHLSSTFSRGTSDLRLEPSSQTEVYYDINRMTLEQQSEAEDPSWTGDSNNDDQLATDSISVEQGLTNYGASDLAGGLDGRGWKAQTTRDSRAAAKAIVRNAVQVPTIRPPHSISSTSSTSTSAKDIDARIYRTSDGMFFVRGKLIAYNKLYPNATAVPTLMAACVEVKPPLYHLAGQADIYVARKPILNAAPQIIQQAQFILQMYSTLSTVWCLVICGRWVRFAQFTRAKTPEPDPTKICNGEYYIGQKTIGMISPDYSGVFAYLDDDGLYTPTFMKWWNKVIIDAEREYNTYIQSVQT